MPSSGRHGAEILIRLGIVKAEGDKKELSVDGRCKKEAGKGEWKDRVSLRCGNLPVVGQFRAAAHNEFRLEILL